MSRLITGILGATALSLLSGAVQFALGHDKARELLISRDIAEMRASQRDQLQPLPRFSGGTTFTVNRGAKSDRVASPSGLAAQTKTVSIRLEGFLGTSLMLRVPIAEGSFSPAPAQSAIRKPMVACEAVVSVLTEVAKQLQPGRCIA
jgi:hypothetical protein